VEFLLPLMTIESVNLTGNTNFEESSEGYNYTDNLAKGVKNLQ
jgi:hypothetical protein